MAALPSPATTRIDWQKLIPACSAVVVFGLAFGMTAPLLSLILAERNVTSNVIGLNSAMMPIGILLCSPLIPKLTDKFGARNVSIAAALLTAVFILAYKAIDHLGAWFLFRMLHGMSIAILFVLSETWIVEAAGSTHRGKIVAIYASLLSASFAAGPFVIGLIGVEGWTPFLLGATAIVIGTLPLFGIKDSVAVSHQETGTHTSLSFTRKAPLLVAAVACFAILDSAAVSLLPVYGIENNLSQRDAAFALTALIIGNVFLQLPIGWLADKFSARSMFMSLALITVVVIALLPWVIHTPLFWPALMIAGSAAYGVYTVALKSLGDRFEGRELLAGTATFSLVWGIGALFGAVGGGWSIALSSDYGLPFMLSGVYLVFLLGNILRLVSSKKP